MQPEKLSKLSSWSNFDRWQMTMDILLNHTRVIYSLMIYKEIIVPVVSAAWRLLWAGDESDSKLWVITWSEWGGLCSRVIQLTASSRLRSDCAAPECTWRAQTRRHWLMPPGPVPCLLSGPWVDPLPADTWYPHTHHRGIFKLFKVKAHRQISTSTGICEKGRWQKDTTMCNLRTEDFILPSSAKLPRTPN